MTFDISLHVVGGRTVGVRLHAHVITKISRIHSVSRSVLPNEPWESLGRVKRMLLKRGTGSGERGTEVWVRVVSGNLHKNPIWPMIETNLTDNGVILLELYAHEVLEIIRR